jgi:hypothetical protein
MDLITFICLLWMIFYMLNHAALTKRTAAWIFAVLGDGFSYVFQCGICWPFWASSFSFLMGWIPLSWIVIAPVAHLFIELTYQRMRID